MRVAFERKLILGFFSTIILVVFFSFIAFRAIKEVNSSHKWVSHTQLVLRSINLMANDLSTAEEKYGDYIITGNPRYHTDFNKIISSFSKQRDILRLLVSDNPTQEKRFNAISKYSSLRIEELKQNIKYRAKYGLEASSAQISKSSGLYREMCRLTINKMLNNERQLLIARREKSNISNLWAQRLLAGCIFFGITMMILLYRSIRLAFKAKQRAEESLRISEGTFSTAFHSSGIGIALVSPQGNILNVNESLCLLCGFKREDLLNNLFLNLTHPEDKESCISAFQKLKKGEISGHNYETRYIHKDGQTIYIILNISLVRHPDNSPAFFISQITDISESKKITQQNQRILDANIDVICSVDGNGKFIHLSKACEKVWGYRPEELIGIPYMQLVLPEDHAKTEKIAAEIIAGTPVTNFENRYIHKNGSIVPIIWSGSWSEEEGVIFCIARDGSEKQRLEKALEEERQRFEDLFLQAPSCIAVIQGLDFRFKMANPLFEEITGKKDLVGKRLSEALPQRENQDFYTLLEKVYTSGEFYAGKEKLAKLNNQNNGTLSNAYFDFVYQPYKDNTGKIEGIFVFANDVTQQVIARKKIEESEKRYKQLIEEMPGAVYTCDAEGRIILYNKAAAELWGREPIIGKDLWCGSMQIFDKEGNPIEPDECPMAQTIKKGIPVRGAEIIVAKPNGELRDVQPHPFPLFDEDGKMQGAINMLIDITSHKKAEETLRIQQQALQTINIKLSEKNKAIEEATIEIAEKATEIELSSKYKSEFLANMSHELRTPLNAVLVLTSLLAENPNENLTSKQLEYTEIIYRSGSDLLTLINDILDLAKIESGKLNLVYDHSIISHIMQDIQQLFTVMANKKNIRFTVQMSEDVPVVIYTDKIRLEQILKNLLSNAFKFTPENGSIELNISFREGDFIFAVTDSGIGIEQAKKGIIFEAFQQANGSTNRKFGGTGLGLSICKELIKKFDGTIELESEPGKGSTFIVKLPMQECADSTPLTFKISEPEENLQDNILNLNFNGRKLLIVDDDIRNIYAMSSILETYEIDFYTATNGIEALEQLNAHQDIALVVMDMTMPEMDGYEAMRQIRQMNGIENIPIIALTAKAMLGDAEQCMEAGASDYITKPFLAQHLISQIKYWMDKR